MTAPSPSTMRTPDDGGLRERKKRATRLHISEVATGLFVEQGFEATTIAQIAERAQVAKMTVTNHFPLKEDLLFDRAPEIVRFPADAVADRAPGTTAAAALRAEYERRLADRWPPLGFGEQRFAATVDASPALRLRERMIMLEQEDALADVLATEAGDTSTRGVVTARAEAARLVGPVRALYRGARALMVEGASRDEIAAFLAAAAPTTLAD